MANAFKVDEKYLAENEDAAPKFDLSKNLYFDFDEKINKVEKVEVCAEKYNTENTMFVRVNNVEKRTNFDYLMLKTAKIIDLKMKISEKGHKTPLK